MTIPKVTSHSQKRTSLNRADIYDALCKLLSEQADEVEWTAWGEADWARLARLAKAEGAAPLAYWTLTGESGDVGAAGITVPEQVVVELQREYYQTAAHNALLYEELGRILAALAEETVPVIVLKGAALIPALYPDPGLRPMGDLDLLVHREHLAAALQVLKALGYARPTDVDSRTALRRLTGRVQFMLGGPGDRIAVDVHWNLVAGDADWRSPPLGWFWEQTRPLALPPELQALNPAGAFCLNPAAHALYVSAHAMLQHGGAAAQLIWQIDLHRLIERFGHSLDWELMHRQAVEFRWAAALHHSLNRSQTLFGTPVPQGFLARIASVRDATAIQLVDRLDQDTKTRSARRWDQMATLNWNGRLHLALKLVLPNPAYLRLCYNPQPSWTWPLYYPYRWWDIASDGLQTLLRSYTRRRAAKKEAYE